MAENPQTISILRLGFRPFFLLGGLYSALIVPLWILQFAGVYFHEGALTGMQWHLHEMLFGFFPAILTGFLFTAVHNWTKRPTPTGPLLLLFILVWLSGRVVVLLPYPVFAAVVDSAFLPIVALAIAVPILKSRNYRNLGVVMVVSLLGALNILFHLDALGLIALAPRQIPTLTFDLASLLMAIIAGRIIPIFTRNALSGSNPKRIPLIERIALGSLVAIFAADVIAPSGLPFGMFPLLLALAMIAHAIRLFLWDPLSTRSNPILWILPLSYLWIPIALALRLVTEFTPIVPTYLWFHAISVGAMAGLMLAMMTRTSLGHTGRPIKAGPMEIAIYTLVGLAALTRVVGPLVLPLEHMFWVVISGGLWSFAFLLYVVRYLPILTTPRSDV